MPTGAHYQGILFPERAESLAQYHGYKVFLDFWDPLSRELRAFYEGMALRGETRCLAVYGPQGGGKTLFANKLVSDFGAAREAILRGPIEIDENNLWHRMTSAGGVSPELVERATLNTEVLHIEDDREWVSRAVNWKEGRPGRHCIIIADNAERDYFVQSLLGLSDADFLRFGSQEAAYRTAAQKLVALARGQLRGCLFLLLTNNELFLLNLDEYVEAQHSGLLRTSTIPLPGSREKEVVVRVNTNRLNRISYWFCLDKAGPDEKKNVYKSLGGASTFPDSFAAVNRAIRTAEASRIGRPAKKGVISLMVLHGKDTLPGDALSDLGELERTDFAEDWLSINTFRKKWATRIMDDNREADLLESEWQLRVVTFGPRCVASLLNIADDHVNAWKYLLELLRTVHGPGTWESTRESYARELRELMDSWPSISDTDLTDFWHSGQSRSRDYEGRLRVILPGYNTGGTGFLTYRPDYIVTPFRPCSILEASSVDGMAINTAIRRDAHVYEFVAIADPTSREIQNYLRAKVRNYVSIVQEQ
jgi:hypothetical protein